MKNKIKKIIIENFRKLDYLEIEFKEDDKNYYAVTGPNAVGKTSVLEAINVALSTRSSKYTEVKESDFYSTDSIKFTVEFKNHFFLSFEDNTGYERLIPCNKFKKVIKYRSTKERLKTFSSEYDINLNFFP